MSSIKHITSREILNAKGDPTVETTVVLENGIHATASIPTGTSVSSYEALDLKDNDTARFAGKGVLKAIHNVTDVIAPALIGENPTEQSKIDTIMNSLDGTPNKSKLGANAILSISLAVAKVAAISEQMPLFRYIRDLYNSSQLVRTMPLPLFNLINGGKHALGSFDIQEFIVIPAFQTFSQNIQAGFKVRQSLEKMLMLNKLSTLIGDEGGFSPQLAGNTFALQFLKEATEEAGFRLGTDVNLGIDAAATSFYENNKYALQEKGTSLSSDELISFYETLTQDFPLTYLEDPFSEDDWEGWEKSMPVLSRSALVVGDDLISTNPARLQMALEKKAITAVIIKPNQIGTLTETLDVVKKSKEAGLKIIVSHRSGETNDDFVSDLAVGINADYCKFGAPVRGERVAKYNRLLQIEKEL